MKYSLNIPTRTNMTPGPVAADPRVLRIMSAPILGQFDPEFLKIMDETMELSRYLFRTENKWAYAVDGTARAGIEAVLAGIIEKGDKVLVPIFGRFGHLLSEIAKRCGAEVIEMEKEWGNVFTSEEVKEKISKVKPKIVAMIHGETSTGRLQPLKEIGKFCRENDILFVVDCVATIGGVEFSVDDYYIDAAIAGSQKCISVPTGMALVTYNERVEKILEERKKVEQGLGGSIFNPRYIQSNYLDLSQIQDYWSEKRLNHHTEATTMLYAMHEGLAIIKEEGLEERIKRHKYHEKAIIKGIEAMGLKVYGDLENKMPTVTCVCIPEGVNGDAVRATMLKQFGVEIASSFGSLNGKIWRIGNMGYSSKKENVLQVLMTLEASILYHGGKINIGQGVQAALKYYEEVEA